MDMKDTHSEGLPIVMDERVCSDTILRVVKLSKDVFLVYDIFVLNGTDYHARKPFQQRREMLAEILELFHSPVLTALIHVDDAPVGSVVRGMEYYDTLPGSIGIFLECESK
jgi:hypothetical protein